MMRFVARVEKPLAAAGSKGKYKEIFISGFALWTRHLPLAVPRQYLIVLKCPLIEELGALAEA
jgi:hypothetical protein